MEAHAKTIRNVLESGSQFLIPFFQRSYSWRKAQWERLWTDIMNLMEDRWSGQHFMGPLVCTLAKASPGELPAYLLIDGQQRLTTITLLLAALRDLCHENKDDKQAAKIHESYLVHRHEERLQHYRIIPRVGDRETLIAIIQRAVGKEHRRSPLHKAWRFFQRAAEELIDSDENGNTLAALISVVTDRLSLVVITIDGENPYEIFESLNSTGLPLEESDLIRNYLFMQIPLDKQDHFNESHWNTFESRFEGRESEAAKAATAFYRHYLMRNGEYSKSKATFIDFRKQNKNRELSPEAQVDELKRFARLDQVVSTPQMCDDDAIKESLTQISYLDISTARPLLLNLLDRHEQGSLSADDFIGSLSDLASFVIRRSICGESSRSYGLWFVKAIESVRDDPRTDLRKCWFTRGWPDDTNVIDRLRSFPIYSRELKKLRLILNTLEKSHGHKEVVSLDKLTIEHVMPQTIGTSKDGRSWQAMLGETWKDTHRNYLHTLGNMTLTGYNASLSNKSFERKKKEFAKSHVELNEYFDHVGEWNEAAIVQRTEALAQEVVRLWPRPEGGPAYVPTPEFSENEKEFCAEYWGTFSELLRSEGFSNEMATNLSKTILWIKGPRKCFWYFVDMTTADQCIGVGIYTSGKSRKEYLYLLWWNVTNEDQEQIETEIEELLCWDAHFCGMYAEHEDVILDDRSKWRKQHTWLVNCVRTFQKRLEPLILDISLDEFKPEIAREFEASHASDEDESVQDQREQESEEESLAIDI